METSDVVIIGDRVVDQPVEASPRVLLDMLVLVRPEMQFCIECGEVIEVLHREHPLRRLGWRWWHITGFPSSHMARAG